MAKEKLGLGGKRLARGIQVGKSSGKIVLAKAGEGATGALVSARVPQQAIDLSNGLGVVVYAEIHDTVEAGYSRRLTRYDNERGGLFAAQVPPSRSAACMAARSCAASSPRAFSKARTMATQTVLRVIMLAAAQQSPPIAWPAADTQRAPV